MNAFILVVRHGPGRGRIDGYMDPLLAFMKDETPDVFRKLRFHATGEPLPDLDRAAAVVFWLADPLREWYPDCFENADAVAAEARRRGIRIVNPPESLSHIIRSVQSRLLREAGIETPEYRRFESVDELYGLLDAMPFPVLIRTEEHHAQTGMHVCFSRREVEAIDRNRILLPGALAPLVDVREGHRPGSIYARFHHKKRLYVLGDRVRTEHVFFSSHPLVSSGTYTFLRYLRWPEPVQRLALLDPWTRRAVHEDLAYWRRETEHEELMLRAAGALGLGFAAIDYSERGDGTPVIWEANPHPFLPPRTRIPLQGPRKATERLTSYHRAFAGFLAGLLPEPPAAG